MAGENTDSLEHIVGDTKSTNHAENHVYLSYWRLPPKSQATAALGLSQYNPSEALKGQQAIRTAHP